MLFTVHSSTVGLTVSDGQSYYLPIISLCGNHLRMTTLFGLQLSSSSYLKINWWGNFENTCMRVYKVVCGRDVALIKDPKLTSTTPSSEESNMICKSWKYIVFNSKRNALNYGIHTNACARYIYIIEWFNQKL